MSKFNTKTKTKTNSTPDALNVAGFPGFERSNFKQEVASIILNSMLNGNSYYESEEDRISKIENLVKTAATESPELSLFLAKAMVYTRTIANLRSISHVLAVSLVENVKGSNFLKPALFNTILRPDDATEIVVLWNTKHPKVMVPNSLRRAIKMTLEDKFTAYHFKKYYGNGSVKVPDLIKLTRPAPKNDIQRLEFKQAIEGTLPKINTAQTVNASLTGPERADMYSKMIIEGTLGYMAALKNIKNILEANPTNETITLLCNLLENEQAVLKSKVLPFRFVDAYTAVKEINMDKIVSNRLLKSINTGFALSSKNVSIVDEDETVAILLDESGSMDGTPFKVGKTLMASMLCGLKKENVLGYLWATNPRRVSINSSPMDFINSLYANGGGTDLGSAMDDLVSSKTKVDKIVIFTDMQENQISSGWGSSRKSFHEMLKAYKQINPKVQVLFWNLEGYSGATPVKLSKDVLEISGYSDKMLEIIPKLWKDESALIKEIESISL